MDISRSALLASTDDPLVTIAIPTFNRVFWLEDCILSVFSQSYQCFEVLVSDNASTDGTADFLRTIFDRRLRVIRQSTNIGLLPNWNACLAAAKGRYIVFVSDDNRIAPHFLDRCIALVRIEPRVPVVVALNDSYSTAGRSKRCSPNASKTLGTGIWNGTDILLEFLKRQISAEMCTIMIRTDALRARGGFPTDLPLAADLAAWSPLLLTGRSALVNECCGTVIRHSGTQTSNHALDLRLRDHKAAVNLIMTIADHSIDDLEKRHEVKLEAQRNIARALLEVLLESPSKGERLAHRLPLFWRYRRDIAMVSVFTLAKLLAILILPVSIADCLRELKLVVRAAVATACMPASRRRIGHLERRE
jgi:glycosyltransferase involved in cell wall biosynthesis